MKKTKVVIILGAFGVGGAEHMVYELTRCMDKTRFDVEILCYMSPKGIALEKQAEEICPVTYLNEMGSINPGTIFRVLREIRKRKPDVVHAHLGGAGFGAIWAMLFRKRFLVTVHTKPEKAFSSKIEKLVRLALKTGKTTLVAVSAENAAAVKKYFNLDERNCQCVNNGIDLSRFSCREHKELTLINVARHDENKNQAALIRCFARLHTQDPNTKLLLLGDGPSHEALIRQVQALGLENAVTFTGNVPNTEDYYEVSDVYVQCSHREAMPLSVLEAMAAGLVIVSTDVGGLKDVVQDNGFLVPDNDEEALYQAIMKVYSQSEEERERMRRASGRIVQSYSSESMARAYEEIYEQV